MKERVRKRSSQRFSPSLPLVSEFTSGPTSLGEEDQAGAGNELCIAFCRYNNNLERRNSPPRSPWRSFICHAAACPDPVPLEGSLSRGGGGGVSLITAPP